MWKRHITPTARFQASTDELAVSVTDDVIGVVALMVAPLKEIMIAEAAPGVISMVFLTGTNQAISVSIQGGIELLESALATASYAYHHGENDDV